MQIRAATPDDGNAIWAAFAPAIREGETYALPRDMTRDDHVAWVFSAGHRVFVAMEGDRTLGAYFYRANQGGGGSHVANAAFATHPDAQGRGVATAMCAHALAAARSEGFRAMQFNFVVATNPAVRLWRRHGFEIVGTLPAAFDHPTLGEVDVHVMYRRL